MNGLGNGITSSSRDETKIFHARNKKKKDRAVLRVHVTPQFLSDVKAHAEKSGLTLNEWLRQAIDRRMSEGRHD